MPEIVKKSVYSVCTMCTVRCPIKAEVDSGAIKHIWGNPHILGGHYLCPRGAAGKVFENDSERMQHPMIRAGDRGSGNWRKVTWEEALDYTADKLKSIMEKHGGESIVLGDRGGPFAANDASNRRTETFKASVMDFIHPRSAHTLHGYRRQEPRRSRIFQKCERDNPPIDGRRTLTIEGSCPIT